MHRIVLLLGLLYAATTAYSQGTWREPWHDPKTDFSTESFIGTPSAFELVVVKSGTYRDWGIQVIGATPVTLRPGRYSVTFRASSSKPFRLCSRLGNEAHDKNYYRDACWDIPGKDQLVNHSRDFAVETPAAGMFHYFLLGLAPAGTKVQVRDIAIKPAN